MRSIRAQACAAAAVLTLGIAGPGSVAKAEEFMRADPNGDGVVSYADADFMGRFLFYGGRPPACEKSADFDDDSRINISDAASILNFLTFGDEAPAAPFPGPGPDPTDDDLPCESYGGGSALDDPAATVRILDASAAGGDDPSLLITVAVSSTAPITGVAGAIRIDPEVIFSAERPTDLTGVSDDQGVTRAKVVGDELRFGMLGSISGDHHQALPGGDEIAVLEIRVCLKEGARAGNYPLALARAELVDAASARRIDPILESATLSVDRDLDAGVGCVPPVVVPVPENPEDVETMFMVGDAEGVRGRTIDVPFVLGSNGHIQAFSFSIDFDEDVLQGLSIDPVYELPNGEEYAFSIYTINNHTRRPGNGGVDEGYLVGAVAFHFTDFSNSIPPGDGTDVLNFRFEINAETTESQTEIRFIDGAVGEGQPVRNKITVGGVTLVPEIASSFILFDGLLKIVGDVSFFRGDSNQDRRVDVADGIHILNYLFSKGGQPGCMDAADSDDSGAVDLADAVAVFGHLFTGTRLPAPVFPDCDIDPTPDDLSYCTPGCSR